MTYEDKAPIDQRWKLNTYAEYAKKQLPAGKYLCMLDSIKQIRTKINPKFWDVEKKGPMPEDGREFKLAFVFRPLEIKTEPDEVCEITKMVRPSSFDRSSCYKLLAQMSPTGNVPPEIAARSDKYQQWAMAMIGSPFWVMSTPSDNGQYNNLVSVMPADDSEITKAMNRAGGGEAPVKPSAPDLAGLSGFEGMPGVESFPYVYDLSKLAEVPRSKAILAIEAAGAKEFNGKFRSPKALDRFAKYLVADAVGEVDPF